MKIVHGFCGVLCVATWATTAHATKNDVETAVNLHPSAININCDHNPRILKTITERTTILITPTEYIVSGRCIGPLALSRGDIVIRGRDGQTTKVVVEQGDTASAGISIDHANVQLHNLALELPVNMPAVIANKNSVVTIGALTSNATSDDSEAFFPFQVQDNSTVTFHQQTNSAVSVSGSSVAEFAQGNTQTTLNVLDTSYARSNQANHFSSVQTSGNAYFLADNQTQVDLLMIWSKSAVDINNESSVGQLMMGGQTLFAAYRNSHVRGPYGIYGNVVFELEHSSAENWQMVDKPHAIFTGNNATVNGVFYPGWSWFGQDSTPE